MALVIHHMIQLIKLYYLVSGFVLTLKINNIKIMSTINLNELKDRAYRIACEHGFHDEEYSNEHFLALIITELSEATEADRKGYYGDTKKFLEAINGYNSEDSPICFESHFRSYIKDSVGDELADAFIRLLDLYGLRNIFLDESGFDEENIQDYSKTYKDKSFTEGVYYIIGQVASPNHSITESCVLPEILLLEILGFAKHLGIDLFHHIDLKMRYNELRPKKHGKKY